MTPACDLVISSENRHYLAWQTQLCCFSAMARLGVRPIVVVHGGEGGLLPEFGDLERRGCQVLRAPSFGATPKGTICLPRNAIGTLSVVASTGVLRAEHLLLCETDMLFVRPKTSQCVLSGEFYPYVDYGDSQVVSVLDQLGMHSAIDVLNGSSQVGVPYVVPTEMAGRLARRWMDVFDRFESPRWIDPMPAFGIAAALEGLAIEVTRQMITNYDQDACVAAETLIHYCYGDARWNKRHYVRAGTPLLDTRVDEISCVAGSVLAHIIEQIGEARRYFYAARTVMAYQPRPNQERESLVSPISTTDASPNSVAELLAPVSIDEFVQLYWKRKVAYIHGDRDRFNGLFSWPHLNAAIERNCFPMRGVQLMHGGSEIPSDSYRQALTYRLQKHRLIDELGRGRSLVIDDVDDVAGDALRMPAEALAAMFSARVSVTASATWPGDQGTTMIDARDTLVCQIKGTRRWETCPPPSSGSDSDRTCESDLAGGDLLYVPGGWTRRAHDVSQPSLHLTFAIQAQSGIDFLSWIANEVHAVLGAQIISKVGSRELHEVMLERMRYAVDEFLTVDGLEAFRRTSSETDGVKVRLPGLGGAPCFRTLPLPCGG
jgi:ribosomal protein L16 Arg81 hydroxylase